MMYQAMRRTHTSRTEASSGSRTAQPACSGSRTRGAGRIEGVRPNPATSYFLTRARWNIRPCWYRRIIQRINRMSANVIATPPETHRSCDMACFDTKRHNKHFYSGKYPYFLSCINWIFPESPSKLLFTPIRR